MEKTLYIAKNKTLRKEQDYTFLRKEGLSYIESLASKLWTDYNTHDPGITILEALCYAITELGYRTDFDIKDLMADEDGNINIDQAFFSAKNILASEPLTIEDYRKILVDIVGVKNAWLYPYRDEDVNLIGKPDQEVPVFAHCKKDQLVYEETEHPISFGGLYSVVLDLDETDEFGDLNTGAITYQFAISELMDVKLQIILPNWDDTNKIDYEFIVAADPTTISNINVSFLDNRWRVKFNIENSSDIRSFDFGATVLGKKDISFIESFITTQFNSPAQLAGIFSVYQKKIDLVLSILVKAKGLLHAHRNIAEDFIKLRTICTQEVAFCADIEVTPDADIEEVYANILFQLENYLNPDVKFYPLKELMDEGISSDEIFDGPVLTHGFIKTDELKSTQVRRRILVSDIINFIMDTEGVVSVKNVLLTKYAKDGRAVLPSERWCMEIDDNCKPVLDLYRSKVIFFKGKLPFKAKLEETLDTLLYLHGLEQRNKLKGTADDLNMPAGEYYELQDYLSVQYEFPITYGIGEAGLPGNSTPERKAQAKQLKAYLLLFDQVLANFFSQLSHAKELFSTSADVKQTYFAQFLNDIKGVEEIYTNATDLEAVFSKPLSTNSDTVKKTRARLIEDEEIFYDRRNRFVDHLIARFAESFNDYVLMLYKYKNADDYEHIDVNELLDDKLAFIKDYPVISKERGKAFNYLLPSWNTDNVSGLEKRIARLAGIDDFTRHFLFCIKHIEIQKNDAGKYFFEVLDETGAVLLKSLQHYDTYSELNSIVKKLSQVVSDVTFYEDKDLSATQFSFEIWDANNLPLAESGIIFTNDVSRDAAISQVVSRMSEACPAEGMHLVEHILLRPRFAPPIIPGTKAEDIYKLFHVCLGENCHFCGEEDPYSFRLSLILPYWHERFMSMEFRNYFETMVRTETPAHCMIKICWVNNTLINSFERAYVEWMEALAIYEVDLIQKASNQDRLRKASNAMIEILKQLHSEYPEAQLHDCDTKLTNPVLLGNTVLGTYKI
jgi:hypothetical protein